MKLVSFIITCLVFNFNIALSAEKTSHIQGCDGCELTLFQGLESFYLANTGLFSGVGIAASLYGAYQNHQDMKAIKKQLAEINRKLDVVIQLNEMILKRIDLLRAEIRADVKEIVEISELDQRHTLLRTVEFIVLEGNKERYGKDGNGLENMLMSIIYLYEKERRIEKLADVILFSELAIFSTDDFLKGKITELVAWKHNQLVETAKNLEQSINQNWSLLSSKINNTSYIKSTNFYKGIKIENISYTAQSNKEVRKYVTETRTRYSKPQEDIVEYEVRFWKDFPEHQNYNNKKGVLVKEIDALIKKCSNQLENYNQFVSSIKMFEEYFGHLQE